MLLVVKTLILIILILAGGLILFLSEDFFEAPAQFPSAEPLEECLQKRNGSGICLDALIGKFLKKNSVADALAAIKNYEATDKNLRLLCHPITHSIGREALRLKHSIHEAFAACDQTCHSGCYHGVVERFLKGDSATSDAEGHVSQDELKLKVASICTYDASTLLRFQCLHGLGHALMFFYDNKLEGALDACDAILDDWGQHSCYGGVFMENLASSMPEKRDVSSSDYHYPCNKIAPRYRHDCYINQTTRMSEMGLSVEGLFEECREAGEHRIACMQSIGRDLSNDVRVSKPELVAQKCELGTGEDRRACTRGVVFALIDNTWDGKYAFPFCENFSSAEDISYCFKESIRYLKTTIQKSEDEILKNCQEYAPGSETCLKPVS